MKKVFNSEINENYTGKTVELTGWVSKVRNLGGVIFIDLRDRSGIIQLVVNPESNCYELANTLKNEYPSLVIDKKPLRKSSYLSGGALLNPLIANIASGCLI